jgi:hypothetical protein
MDLSEEEKILVERLMLMGQWGFPLGCYELRLLVKAYLDSAGKATRFVYCKKIKPANVLVQELQVVNRFLKHIIQKKSADICNFNK